MLSLYLSIGSTLIYDATTGEQDTIHNVATFLELVANGLLLHYG